MEIRREAVGSYSSIVSISRTAYKLSHKLSELVTRFFLGRASEESLSMVVFENGTAKEIMA